MSKLSQILIEIRTANNLTQEEFAKELFVTRQAVSKWERDICYPDIEILKKISIDYRISLNLLLDIIKQNKDETIKPLANKSYTFVILMIVGTLICLLSAFFMLIYGISNNDEIITAGSAAFFLAGFVSLIITISLMMVPSKPIKYNDYGLFISTTSIKNEFIKYEEIINVSAKNTRARMASYSFGKIILETKNRDYIIRGVSRVDYIKGKIVELKMKNTFSEIN